MNKKLLLMMMAICCLITNGIVAQESIKLNENSASGIYFRIGGGYSLGTAKTSGGANGLMPGSNTSVVNHTNYRRTFDVVKYDEKTQKTTKTNAAFSLGEGINLSLAAGYMLNEYIGIELGANYLNGINNTVTDENSTKNYNEVVVSNGNNGTRQTLTDTSNQHLKESSMKRSNLSLIPAVKLVAPINNKYSMYSRIGLVLPILDKTFYEYSNTESSSYRRIANNNTTSNSSRSSENKEIEFSSYFNLGYTAALGVQYSIGEKVNLFGEINLISTSFEAKKSNITSWKKSSNGNDSNDLLKNMDVYDIETEYLKEYVVDQDSPSPSKNDPKKEASFSLPASSIGLTIGLSFRF